MKSTVCFVLLVALLLVSLGQAQQQTSSNDLEGSLERLSKDAAKQYVGPVVSGIGSDLNAGWFHRAPKATMFDFDLEFGVVLMGTLFSDEHKSFGTSGVFQFDSSQASYLTNTINDAAYNSLPTTQKNQARQQIINQIRGKDYTVGIGGPTIIGNKTDSVKITFKGGQFTFTDPLGSQRTVAIPSTNIALPVTGLLGETQFLGKNMIPLAAPQLTLGTFLGSQFTFRYLPNYKISEELGETKYFGWGVQHNPAVWFPGEFPVDISASFFSQKINAGSIFEAKTTAYGINLSKRLGWGVLNLTPYAGYMVEASSMTFVRLHPRYTDGQDSAESRLRARRGEQEPHHAWTERQGAHRECQRRLQHRYVQFLQRRDHDYYLAHQVEVGLLTEAGAGRLAWHTFLMNAIP
ncbi:hypothetical protein D4R75_10700 [bacterium]|nr:MAG: hypothetical protein D4R75_10700 [bacterium]